MKRTPVIFAAMLVPCLAGAFVEWSNRMSIYAQRQEFESYEHRDGRKEAEADIANGTPRWKVHGRVSDYEEEKALLGKSLGVELDWFQGCISTMAIEHYAFDYNTTTRAHLVLLHGESAVHAVLGDPPKWDSEDGYWDSVPAAPLSPAEER